MYQDIFLKETFKEGVDVRDFATIGNIPDVWEWVREPFLSSSACYIV